VDEASGYIITLTEALYPDYANAETCGASSNGHLSITSNSTSAAAENFWKTI
jgi:hypothetical protein